MDHRRGQRWLTVLPIRIACEQGGPPRPAQLAEFSFHGARIRLNGHHSGDGEVLRLWLPGMTRPLQALVVHIQGGTAGLLWIDRSPWLEFLLKHPVPKIRKAVSQPALAWLHGVG